MLLSDYLSVDRSVLKENGVFNPILDKDSHREKVKTERRDVIYMPALQHAFVPR